MFLKAGIYLDSNAGAPLKQSAQEAFLAFLRDPSGLIPNPSSIHSHGRSAKRILAEARERVALSLGARVDPEQLVFTSSGTEANQLAIRSVFEPKILQGLKPHWITTPVEHDSNRQMIAWLEARGGSVTLLPVNSDGQPQFQYLKEMIRPETGLISVMWVNNETGVISDLSLLMSEAKTHRVPVHIDAAQA